MNTKSLSNPDSLIFPVNRFWSEVEHLNTFFKNSGIFIAPSVKISVTCFSEIIRFPASFGCNSDIPCAIFLIFSTLTSGYFFLTSGSRLMNFSTSIVPLFSRNAFDIEGVINALLSGLPSTNSLKASAFILPPFTLRTSFMWSVTCWAAIGSSLEDLPS